MARTNGSQLWPIGIPQSDKARYTTMWRWLKQHRGPVVRTLPQLERALRQPEVFYILPRKYR